MTTGKTIVLTRQTFVGKVMSLLFNMLSRLIIAFPPRSKPLLISWLQSPSAVILDWILILVESVPEVLKCFLIATCNDPFLLHCWMLFIDWLYKLLSKVGILTITNNKINYHGWKAGWKWIFPITLSMVKQIIHVPLLSLTVRELKKVNLIYLNLDFIVYKTCTLLVGKEMACLENPMDGGACRLQIHGVSKSWTDLHFHFHTLENEMATHSSILTRRIPGTEEPVGLPSMGLHRIRHD